MNANRIMEKDNLVVREPGAQKTANKPTHSEMEKRFIFKMWNKFESNQKVINGRQLGRCTGSLVNTTEAIRRESQLSKEAL